MIIEILKQKQDDCNKYVEDHKAEENFFAAEYSKGQARAYEDAILIMKNVEEAMKEENLRRLLCRFVKEDHLGIVIENFKANIRAGFEYVSSR